MKELLTAIRTAIRADVTINALVPGGIFTGLAKSGSTMPYLVWDHVGSIMPAYNTGLPQIERHLLRFRAFSISAITSIECSEAVENLLVVTPPVLATGTTMQILRDSHMVALDPDLSEHGEEVWVSTVQFEAMIQRNP